MQKYAKTALALRPCSENARLITACNRNFEKLCFFNMLKFAKKNALALRLCSENARMTSHKCKKVNPRQPRLMVKPV